MTDRWIVSVNDWASLWAPAIWRASWQGSLFILSVWLISKTFRSMPASAKSWLWWIASLQLILRFAAITSLDLPILPARTVDSIGDFGLKAAPTTQTPAFEIPVAVSEVQRANVRVAPLTMPQLSHSQAVAPSPKSPSRVSILAAAMGLWMLGIIVCIGISARRLIGARKMLSNANILSTGVPFDLVQEFSIDYGMRTPKLFASDEALCPLVAGWLDPAIVIPVRAIEKFDRSQMRMAIAHEFAHLKRRDLWFGIIPAVSQSLFFFHPLAWLVTHEGAAAREAACDSEALRISGGSPTAYARLLIDSAQSHSSMAVLGSAFGYRLIHRRISMLKNSTGRNARRYRTACTALLALGAVCALPWSVTAQASQPVKTKHMTAAKKPSKARKAPAKKHTIAKHLLAVKPVTPLPIPVRNLPPMPIPPTPAAMAIAPKMSALSPVSPSISVSAAAAAPGLMTAIPARGAFAGRKITPVAPHSKAFGFAGSATMAVSSAAAAPVGGTTRLAEPAEVGFGGSSPAQATAPAPEFGQAEVKTNGDLVSVKFDHVDIHTAITKLFEGIDVSYMIKSDVEVDRVTCSLKNVTREMAIQTILAAVKQSLTYHVENGVYTIFAKTGKE